MTSPTSLQVVSMPEDAEHDLSALPGRQSDSQHTKAAVRAKSRTARARRARTRNILVARAPKIIAQLAASRDAVREVRQGKKRRRNARKKGLIVTAK
jgi:hypothetical protein